MEDRTIVYPSKSRRLFDEDAFIREFDAKVIEAEVSPKGRVRIMLDQTAFFPEGGGQDADTGWVTAGEEAFRVSDTHEKEGKIWHTIEMGNGQMNLPEALQAGRDLHCRIDWPLRFSRMQNHSGEHIVSGLIHKHYGYENVGFHMGSEFTTIDFDGVLSMDQLRKIEREANEVIWKDIAADIKVYPSDELKDLEYRSKKELIGDVRIVSFPEADVCACCGTHVKTAGQIGVIKLFSCVPFHEGCRIEMLCGQSAFDYLNRIWMQNKEVSVLLSAKPLEISSAVEKLKTKAEEQSFRVVAYQDKEISQKAAALAGSGNVILFESDYTPDMLRKLCDAGMAECGGICAVFSGSDEEGYKYAIGQMNGDLRSFVKEMNTALTGRGGGRPYFAQGSVQSAREEITAWLKKRFIQD